MSCRFFEGRLEVGEVTRGKFGGQGTGDREQESGVRSQELQGLIGGSADRSVSLKVLDGIRIDED